MPPTESLPSHPGPEDETRELVQRAQAGDRAARDEVVAPNMGMVRMIGGRYSGSSHDPEDLQQLGCIGLIKAVDRFDLNTGFRFSTYAIPLILGEIRRFLRDDGALRVARPLKLLAARARRLRAELGAQLGRDPTMGELAAAAGCPLDELVAALDSARLPASLDEPLGSDEGDSLPRHESLRDPTPGEPSWLDRLSLEQGLAQLAPRERLLLKLRYLRDQTQVETAAILGISQVQVSRLERRALARVREFLTGGAGGA